MEWYVPEKEEFFPNLELTEMSCCVWVATHSDSDVFTHSHSEDDSCDTHDEHLWTCYVYFQYESERETAAPVAADVWGKILMLVWH